MLTNVANINEPLWRVKTKGRGGCRCKYCFYGYKDLHFVATFANSKNLFLFFLGVLVLFDDVVCPVDAEFAGFGEVGDGKGGVVKNEVEKASVVV
ncbi:MAG: hypothetical protein IJV33_01075 [Bacteroidaceae bacterium]|nr:hypothetical protein [Bacteroidaceae bacterium]